jgi:hypothetical protein
MVQWDFNFVDESAEAAFLAPLGQQRVVRTLPDTSILLDYISTHIGRIFQAFRDFPIEARCLMVLTEVVRSAGWSRGLTQRIVHETPAPTDVGESSFNPSQKDICTFPVRLDLVCNIHDLTVYKCNKEHGPPSDPFQPAQKQYCLIVRPKCVRWSPRFWSKVCLGSNQPT